MRKRLFNVLLAVLLICAFGFTYQSKPQQYEYKIEYNAKEKKVNELASQGWELVAIGSEGSMNVTLSVFVFKRPK